MEKPTTADEILEYHAIAKDLYTAALAQNKEVERLFKSEFDAPRDAADTLTNAPHVLKPARARSILEKFLTLLSVRAMLKVRVIPRNTNESELRATSKLEQWMSGYQRAIQREVRRPIYRHGVYWYLLRGRMCIETRYDPSYLGSEKLAIRTRFPDPNTVFPVWGEDGIGWYTKETQRYAWDLKSEIERMRKAKRKDKWRAVELPDDHELINVVEYWDAQYCAATVDGNLLYVKEHEYGFVPLAEAHCMDTPLADAEWAAQSVLAPIADTLKSVYALVSKMSTGVDLFYWPKILVQTASGEAVMLDSGAPGIETQIPPDAKVTVISPQPNAPVLQQLMAWLQGDISLGALPEIAWGVDPQNLQSGFAISQVLTQIMDKIYDKKEALQLAYGWHFGDVLKLSEHYGKATGAYLSVPVTQEYAGRRGPLLLELTPSDIDGRYSVEVDITPELPQDKLQKAQLAAAYRAPGTNGQPLMDDMTVLEDLLEVEHPERIMQRVRSQALPNESETIKNISRLAAEQEWIETNKDAVKLAQKRADEVAKGEQEHPAPPQPAPVDPNAAAAMMGSPNGQAMIPPDMAQMAPPSSLQPPQMQMQPQDVIPELGQVDQSQARRAYAPPK